VEQLHPFPEDLLIEKLALYPEASEITWCQEEPKNQGAWYPIRHHLQHCTGEKQTLYYTGRQISASPAVGSFAVHQQEQKALVAQALEMGAGDLK